MCVEANVYAVKGMRQAYSSGLKTMVCLMQEGVRELALEVVLGEKGRSRSLRLKLATKGLGCLRLLAMSIETLIGAPTAFAVVPNVSEGRLRKWFSR